MGLLGVALLALPSTALAEPPQVERFGLFEGELLLRAGQPPPPNPFATLCNVSVIYVGSERSRHPQMTVGAYFASAGDSARGGSAPPAWRFRFAPDAVGEWQWSSSCGPEIAAAAGSVRCVAGNAVGGLVANGKDFAHEDGSPHFLIGIELDWLWALELDAAAGVKTAPLEGFIRHITSFGFNHALVNTFANWSNCASSTPRRSAAPAEPPVAFGRERGGPGGRWLPASHHAARQPDAPHALGPRQPGPEPALAAVLRALGSRHQDDGAV